MNRNKTAQNKAGQKAIENDCADQDGVWTGPIVAEADKTDAEAEPEQGEVPSGGRRKRRRADDGKKTPARKRVRK